ncbi:hypothetical protein FLM48_17855 [Shewanella sp. Scap07]|uniref:S41 family peptidase n=1 Tax=Shewanella sp. Scap07 TaxID=2589987 RepID=UPI0015BE51B1|nr:S41 family peptidase [Shewanella sp. Scap07]QLE86771.1 hypothetical protein FLM48_17855 [Shewanella sp. Scap07]
MQFGAKTIINFFGLAMLTSGCALGLIALNSDWQNTHLSPYQANKDLQVLQQQISQHSAIAAIDPSQLNQVIKASQQFQQILPSRVSVTEFVPEVQKILAQLDDINAHVKTDRFSKQLPIHIRYIDNQFIALNDKGSLQISQYPYLTHLDGLPLSYWLSAAARYLPSGLSQDYNALLTQLSYLPQLRQEIGARPSETVTLTLSDGQQSHQQTIALIDSDRPPHLPFSANWVIKPQPSNVFEIGNFNQFANDAAFKAVVTQSLLTPLTILDLRRGHGTNSLLTRALAGYYGMQSYSGIQPPVAIARYRLNNRLRADYLQSRQFEPFEQFSSFEQLHLTTASQAAHSDNDSSFGQWFARKAPFSQIKVSPLPTHNKVGKLALIIGPQCRGECQWLVHFAQSWPNVTLIGTATRGDFDLKHRFTLPKSNIDVTLTNSLVYDMHGQLLTGRATQPDIELTVDENIHWPGLLDVINSHSSTAVTQ